MSCVCVDYRCARLFIYSTTQNIFYFLYITSQFVFHRQCVLLMYCQIDFHSFSGLLSISTPIRPLSLSAFFSLNSSHPFLFLPKLLSTLSYPSQLPSPLVCPLPAQSVILFQLIVLSAAIITTLNVWHIAIHFEILNFPYFKSIESITQTITNVLTGNSMSIEMDKMCFDNHKMNATPTLLTSQFYILFLK